MDKRIVCRECKRYFPESHTSTLDGRILCWGCYQDARLALLTDALHHEPSLRIDYHKLMARAARQGESEGA